MFQYMKCAYYFLLVKCVTIYFVSASFMWVQTMYRSYQ